MSVVKKGDMPVRIRRWPRTVACFALFGVLALGGCSKDDDGSDSGDAYLPGEGADVGKVVVYRDDWGVPHIYAPTVEDGLYAQGWAQAQDRPEQLLRNYLIAIGEISSVDGESGLPSDLRSHLFDHYGTAQRSWEQLLPTLQNQLRAYADGINAYYTENPQDTPVWWQGRRVDPYMVLAFERYYLYNWAINEAYGDLIRGGAAPGGEIEMGASNEFAVAPERSAEGAAILGIDPHLPWGGPSRFWEFRVHAADWQGSGAALPGMPYVALGHTRYLAWAMTTGGPDTADIYELELDYDGASYRYDGEWRELGRKVITLQVKGVGPRMVTLWSSHHGPLIARDGGKAWAAKIAYQELAGPVQAFFELNFGRDYTGAVRATETLTLLPINLMAADTMGNIYYQRSGRVPVRPDGFDWSVPVDGSSSASEWQGFHPASDHLQVLNPPQGYLQNCNVPPDAMMPDGPFSLEKSLDYLYGSRAYGPLDGWTNQRGARAIELLQADDSVTAEEARGYLNDVTVYGADRWLEALRMAHEAHGSLVAGRGFYQAAIDRFLEWDQRLARDSSAALKYAYWRQVLAESLSGAEYRALSAAIDDWYAIVERREEGPLVLTEDQMVVLVSTFADAIDLLVENHGFLDAVYGDRFRVGRGDSSWPVGGGDAPGTSTLRYIDYGGERLDRTLWGNFGQSATQLVVMTDPPQSWTYLPLGESDRADSPHYRDQAEWLFSPRQMKPSRWLPEELQGYIESRTVLEGSAR